MKRFYPLLVLIVIFIFSISYTDASSLKECFFPVLNQMHALNSAHASQVNKTTLRVMIWSWSNQVDSSLARSMAEFEEIRGIDIDLILVPRSEEYWKLLFEHLESQAPPDVFWIHDDMVLPLVQRGLIIKLDTFDYPFVKEAPSELLMRFQYEGRLYGIPLGEEKAFALNAFAVSFMAEELGRIDTALELIKVLQSTIQQASIPSPALANGWCCTDAEVFPASEEECRERRGQFSLTKEEAEKLCLRLYSDRPEVKARKERMNRLLDEWALRPEELKELVFHFDNIRTAFEEIFQTKREFLDRYSVIGPDVEHELPDRKYEHFLANLEITQNNYSRALNAALEYLDRAITKEQFTDFYGYLYDELWYEGLIDETKMTTHPAGNIVMDTTEIERYLQKHDEEEVAKEFQKMLEMEGKAVEWKSERFPPEPRPEPEQDPELPTVIQLEPQTFRNCLPPWQGMPLGPVSLDRIRYLFEGMPQHIIEFFHSDFFMPAKKLMLARNDAVKKGWCCLDGKIYHVSEGCCERFGGRFFHTRGEAEEFCSGNVPKKGEGSPGNTATLE